MAKQTKKAVLRHFKSVFSRRRKLRWRHVRGVLGIIGSPFVIMLVGLLVLAVPIAYLAEPYLHGSSTDQFMQICGIVVLTLPFTLPLIVTLANFAMEASR